MLKQKLNYYRTIRRAKKELARAAKVEDCYKLLLTYGILKQLYQDNANLTACEPSKTGDLYLKYLKVANKILKIKQARLETKILYLRGQDYKTTHIFYNQYAPMMIRLNYLLQVRINNEQQQTAIAKMKLARLLELVGGKAK